MATPLTPAQWLTNLRAEGVTVREHAGWTTHERDTATGRTFGPVHGVVIHHTAGRDSLALCWSGMTDLPGPLCHTHLSKAGTATMLSAGRANHAGSFAANAHAAVLAEAAVHPRPDEAEPVDANDAYYGIEIENLGDGKDPYPGVQFDAAVRWAAAICRAHGWTENSVIGHKEGTRRKIDPSFDMGVFRAAVAARLAHDAGWNPNEEEDPMAGITKQDIFDAVWKTDAIVAPSDAADVKTNPSWAAQSVLRDIQARVRANTAAEAAQTAAIAKLASLIGDEVDTAQVVAAVQQAISDAVVKVSVDVTSPQN